MDKKYYLYYSVEINGKEYYSLAIGTLKELAKVLIDKTERDLNKNNYEIDNICFQAEDDTFEFDGIDLYLKLVDYEILSDEDLLSILSNYSYFVEDYVLETVVLFENVKEIYDCIAEDFNDIIELNKPYEEMSLEDKECLINEFLRMYKDGVLEFEIYDIKNKDVIFSELNESYKTLKFVIKP